MKNSQMILMIFQFNFLFARRLVLILLWPVQGMKTKHKQRVAVNSSDHRRH